MRYYLSHKGLEEISGSNRYLFKELAYKHTLHLFKPLDATEWEEWYRLLDSDRIILKHPSLTLTDTVTLFNSYQTWGYELSIINDVFSKKHIDKAFVITATAFRCTHIIEGVFFDKYVLDALYRKKVLDNLIHTL